MISLPDKLVIFSPEICTSPDVGLSNPPTQFKNVVLPDPDGPTTEVNSPSLNKELTLFTALTSNFPGLYILDKFFVSIIIQIYIVLVASTGLIFKALKEGKIDDIIDIINTIIATTTYCSCGTFR